MSAHEDINPGTAEHHKQEPCSPDEELDHQGQPEESLDSEDTHDSEDYQDDEDYDDYDDEIPERVDTMWVPDVKPDWWTDELEEEMRRDWEADQVCHPEVEYQESPPMFDRNSPPELQGPVEPQAPPEWRRHPDDSFLQKPHQAEYNLGITYPIVTPWDQHIEKFNAARNPMKPADLEQTRYMKEVKQAQPHRHVCAHDPDPDRQPIPTYGHLMLPESYDPIIDEGLPDPGFPRLTWSPDTPAPEVLQGAARDLADVGSTFAARLRVSIGHEADANAIDKFQKVALAMKNLHYIINAPKPRQRKNVGGRPRKTGRKRRSANVKIQIETIEKTEIAKTQIKVLAQPYPTSLSSIKTSENDKLPAPHGPTKESAIKT